MDVRKRKRPAVGLAITEQTSEDDDEDSGYHRVSNKAKKYLHVHAKNICLLCPGEAAGASRAQPA